MVIIISLPFLHKKNTCKITASAGTLRDAYVVLVSHRALLITMTTVSWGSRLQNLCDYHLSKKTAQLIVWWNWGRSDAMFLPASFFLHHFNSGFRPLLGFKGMRSVFRQSLNICTVKCEHLLSFIFFIFTKQYKVLLLHDILLDCHRACKCVSTVCYTLSLQVL